MSNSQNGWPVVTKADCDQGPFAGVAFPNGILAGDVAAIARWQLARYVATVEPLKAGSCWGWFNRAIRGSTTISNHASATAWDINADEHPLGTSPGASFSAHQIAACRAIVAASHGMLRWGGDYSGRKDPMHWEIVGTRAEVAAFARIIKEETVDAADIKQIWQTDGMVGTASNATDRAANPTRSPAESLTNIEYHVRAVEAALAAQGKALTSAITALAAKDQVDEAALAKDLAPAVAALIIPALPAGADVTADQLEQAIVGALRELAADPAQS